MEVIISGGGIAGLATAGFLMQQGIKPILIEQAKQWSKAGYGIALWGNGMKMMQALGLDEKLIKKGLIIDSWTIRDSHNKILTEANLDFENIPPLSAIHRADLHNLLLSNLPEGMVQMGRSIEDIKHKEEIIEIKLSNGDVLQADLLIGADGAHSNVRQLLFKGKNTEAKETGMAVFSFWVPESLEVPDGFNEIYSENGKVILFASVNGKKMCSLGFRVGDKDKSEHLELLKDKTSEDEALAPELIKIIEKGENVFHDHIYQVKIDRWTKGRAVLIGDAAHAMHPIVGMGASLALEDAYVLNQEILDHKYGDIQQVLSLFEKRRKKRIKTFYSQADLTSAFTFLENKMLVALRNKLVANSGLFEGFFMDSAAKTAKDVLSDI